MVPMSTDTQDTAATTAVEATVDAYLQTWNETDPAAAGRARRSRRSAPTSGTATRCWRPTGSRPTTRMIAAVQAQMPGLVMTRTSPIDAHRDLVRFNWALGVPGEAPVFAGLDVAKTDADGKLHRIIGFAGETIPAA